MQRKSRLFEVLFTLAGFVLTLYNAFTLEAQVSAWKGFWLFFAPIIAGRFIGSFIDKLLAEKYNN